MPCPYHTRVAQTPSFLSGCDIDFCHFCDPPKPGVKRADGDLLGSKIAKNCRKTPKTAKNKTLEGFKIGGNGAKLIFCPFCDPPKPGVERVDGDLMGSKIAKNCRKTPKMYITGTGFTSRETWLTLQSFSFLLALSDFFSFTLSCFK